MAALLKVALLRQLSHTRADDAANLGSQAFTKQVEDASGTPEKLPLNDVQSAPHRRMSGPSGGASVPATPVARPSQLLQAFKAARLHKRPRVLTALGLWAFGLFAIFLSPAPVRLTDDKLRRFEQRLDVLAKAEKPMHAAEQRWLDKERSVSQAKEWFWRFKPAVRDRVRQRQAVAAEARQGFKQLERDAQRKYSDAKAELGLFSDAGIDEGRRLFWRAFESGKVFGRRQTFWDGLITLLTSREEGIAGMLVQFIIQAMINFTTGMLASVVIFVCQLPGFLASYQPSLLGGLAFFAIATVGALSVLASFLAALYAAGATAIWSIATISPNARLGSRGRRRGIRHHYD